MHWYVHIRAWLCNCMNVPSMCLQSFILYIHYMYKWNKGEVTITITVFPKWGNGTPLLVLHLRFWYCIYSSGTAFWFLYCIYGSVAVFMVLILHLWFGTEFN